MPFTLNFLQLIFGFLVYKFIGNIDVQMPDKIYNVNLKKELKSKLAKILSLVMFQEKQVNFLKQNF